MEQPPSSPGTNPVDLRNCVEELVKFTLHSQMNGTLEWDIGLSQEFCSSLLDHHSADPISTIANSPGVSQNPLYIQLASAFYEIITFGSLQASSKCNKLASSYEGSGLKQKEEIASGALILFNKCLVLEVQDVHRYASFFEMLEAESLAKVLPGVETIDEGIQVYRKFYSEEKEMSNGVLAICVAKVAAQPYLSLARILSGLSYEGVHSLINEEHLLGSIP
ncbi:hypothetical protein QQP08_013609 [Theobroma cacao]|nr:hypothetical protein QQP08_013609 [Theobroma cacao]